METEPILFWIDRLKSNPNWGKFRFKRLKKGHFENPNVDIQHDLIDVVNLISFDRIEEDYLLLFIEPSY